ncbi:MAG: ABC transporter ATP-binding protein/permease [Eubacterium sp.]|nr:ABC transporter ATP-binding protein/permease [Eubacterium sp.]
MKRLSSYILRQKWRYFFGIVFLLCSVGLDLSAPVLTKHVVDDVIVGGKIELLKYLLLGYLLVGLGRFVFQYSKEYLFDVAGSTVARDIRRDVFTHIQGLSTEFFEKTGTGELMARVKDDVDRIWDGLTYVSMLLIEVTVHTFIILTYMYLFSWKLAIIPTVAMIICGTIAIAMEKKLDGVYEEIIEENATLTTVAEENLAGVRTIKAFAREKFEIEKFLKHNSRYYELNMKQSKVFVKYYPYLSVITKVLPLVTLLAGGYQHIYGALSLGTLTAFIEYSNNIVWPMEMLGWLTNSASSAVASSRKIKRIMEEKPTVVECEVPVQLEEIKGKITFEHVSFHKEDGYEILKNIDFEVKPGETIGIMGATGAGKSSIVHVLQRLYDVTDGRILVDDVDIRELPLKQLRESIAVVMQDVFLFSDTISENIKFGKKRIVSDEMVRVAAKDAEVHEFVERFDNEYDTVIGERGVGLSGGQKQRISIARALSKHSPILVMDDSTSALDTETEKKIEHILKELTGTTKIIVAHRISAVRNANLILVLEDGVVKERGTHEELMQKKGLYYETYQVQYDA